MIWLPYGRSGIWMKEDGVAQVLEPAAKSGEERRGEEEIVREAMEMPIASPRLEELARGQKTAVILVSDHTRAVPSRLILPLMLGQLRAGNPKIDISLLVATGCHRGTTRDELAGKLGKEILENEKILVHNCDDAANLVSLGKLPSGADLVINRLAAEADLLVAEGFIEPHFFAGFSGGRKSVLPGICSRTTVLENHCACFIDDVNARSGCLDGNPIHLDMAAAASMAGLRYIVNVTLDEKKKVTAAFAGSPQEAHRAGCEFLREQCVVRFSKLTPIVVTSNGGAPLDQNIYQTVKGLSTAAEAAADGGAIIICAECADGVGGENFYQELKACESIKALLAEIRSTPAEQTVPDQWQYQILAKILEKKTVIYVTQEKWAQTIREMKMEYAKTLEEALEMAAKKTKGQDITVIPDGASVILERKSSKILGEALT